MALPGRGRPAHRWHHAYQPLDVSVLERRIHEIAKIVHDAGGLLYHEDGANLNAILGKVKPRHGFLTSFT